MRKTTINKILGLAFLITSIFSFLFAKIMGNTADVFFNFENQIIYWYPDCVQYSFGIILFVLSLTFCVFRGRLKTTYSILNTIFTHLTFTILFYKFFKNTFSVHVIHRRYYSSSEVPYETNNIFTNQEMILILTLGTISIISLILAFSKTKEK